MSSSEVFVVVGTHGGHALSCGGLSVLERALRTAARQGASRAVIAAPPLAMSRPMPLLLEWVEPGSPAPAGMTVVHGDQVLGQPITDEASRRQAERRLVAGLGKSYEGPIDRYFNALFSRPLTRLLMRTPITPNQITVLATLIGLLGAWLLLHGRPALGGTLLQVQCIIDSCDGEIARLKFMHSRLGAWLDTLTDGLLDNGFVVCAALAAGGPWRAIGLAAVALRLVVEVYVYLDVYRKTGTGDQTRFRLWYEPADASSDAIYDHRTFNSWFRTLGRRETVIFGFWLLCLAGLASGVVVYATILDVVSFVGITASGRMTSAG